MNNETSSNIISLITSVADSKIASIKRIQLERSIADKPIKLLLTGNLSSISDVLFKFLTIKYMINIYY